MSENHPAGGPASQSGVPQPNPYADAPLPNPYADAPQTNPYAVPTQAYGAPPVGQPYAAPYATETGRIRSTGVCILLTIVTLGIYPLVWYYQTHDEMKRHTGQGLGGGLALVLAFFVGVVMPYISSSEVGSMYERAGRPAPVSVATGLWYFPGMLILIGPLVWFVKTNGALNDYWRSLGVSD